MESECKEFSAFTTESKPPICYVCLSADRKLYPLGEKYIIFCKLLDYDNLVQKPDIPLCWECMAVLRKVEHFKEKVEHAQTVLSFHDFSLNSQPKCFTTLTCTTPVTVDVFEPILEIEEIKQENDEDEIFESDGYDHDDGGFKPVNENDSIEIPVEFNKIDVSVPESYAKAILNQQKKNLRDRKKSEDLDYNPGTEFTLNTDTEESGNDETKINQETYLTPRTRQRDKVLVTRHKKYILETKEQKTISSTKKCDIKVEKEEKSDDKKQNTIKNENADDDKKDEEKIVKKKHKWLMYDDFSKYVKLIEIDLKDVQYWMEKDRNDILFKEVKSKCEKCVLTISENQLKTHMKLHVKSTTKKHCDLCDSWFKTRGLLDLHIKKTHKHVRQCLLCGKKHYARNIMRTHLRRHASNKQCMDCKGFFRSPKELRRHRREKHSEFICDYCGMKYKYKHKIEAHILSQHCEPRKCDLCNRMYRSYENHRLLWHTEPKTQEEAFCVECNKQFVTVLQYQNHIALSVQHEGRERYDRQKQQMKCPDCPKVYLSSKHLNYHHDVVHKQQPKLKCPHCGKPARDKSSLKKHINHVHLKIKGEKKKMCPHCGRGFSNNRILTNHIRTHTGERPHQCQYCPAAFAQKIALTGHVKRIHLKVQVPRTAE